MFLNISLKIRYVMDPIMEEKKVNFLPDIDQGRIQELRMGGSKSARAKRAPIFLILWRFLRHKQLLRSRSLV